MLREESSGRQLRANDGVFFRRLSPSSDLGSVVADRNPDEFRLCGRTLLPVVAVADRVSVTANEDKKLLVSGWVSGSDDEMGAMSSTNQGRTGWSSAVGGVSAGFPSTRRALMQIWADDPDEGDGRTLQVLADEPGVQADQGSDKRWTDRHYRTLLPDARCRWLAGNGTDAASIWIGDGRRGRTGVDGPTPTTLLQRQGQELMASGMVAIAAAASGPLLQKQDWVADGISDD
ncbi:hypothetical protein ACLOJK_000692 [Asimina triloba]